MRSAAEVADRLVALKCVVVYALGAPPREVVAQLRARASQAERARMDEKADEARDAFWTPVFDTPVFDVLTGGERELAESTLVTMTIDQQATYAVRLESIAMLSFALGLIELPPFDQRVERDVLSKVPSPKDLERFRAAASLRPESDIERARAEAELWFFRAQVRVLASSGEDIPEALRKPGVRTFDDLVRVTTAHAFQDGFVPKPIDSDFPVRGAAYRDVDDAAFAELHAIAAERRHALGWIASARAWDDTDEGE